MACIAGLGLVVAGSGSVGAVTTGPSTGHANPTSPTPTWLNEINRYRVAAGLAPASENTSWEAGITAHLAYLANTSPSLMTGAYASENTENPASAWYTASGAVESGKAMLATGEIGWSSTQFVDSWLSAPLSAIDIMRPGLTQVALSSNPTTGDAGLDVTSGLTSVVSTSPVLFPGNGMATSLGTYSGGEVPFVGDTCSWNPLSAAGVPVEVQLPYVPVAGMTASITGPGVNDTGSNGGLCLVNQYTYSSTDLVNGPIGKNILTNSQAVVLLPRAPLGAGTYSVTINQSGKAAVTWSFTEGPVFAISSVTVPAVSVGVAYSTQLSTIGGVGADTWSVASGVLPAGLALSSSGVLSGTASALSSSDVTVAATDSETVPQSVQAVVHIDVVPASVPGAPIHLSVAPGVTSMGVSWSPPSDRALSGITSYTASAGPGLPSCSVSAPTTTCTISGLAEGTHYTVTVRGTNSIGLGAGGSVSTATTGPPPFDGNGYWIANSDGSVHGFGTANVYGDAVGSGATPVAIEPTASGQGYWVALSDGNIDAFGNAGFYRSPASLGLNVHLVAFSATPDGKGYWAAGPDGGIFSFGDAQFYGSMGGRHLNQPIVGMTSTADGRGYWEVAADGGIFSFGDAAFYGSMGGSHLNKPIEAMTQAADGHGYRMVASDGGIFSFGDAQFYGSLGATHLNAPVTGMAPTKDGRGYWMLGADGGVFSFGDATFHGTSPPGSGVSAVAIA